MRPTRRSHESGSEPLRLGGDQLHRHALDGHADHVPLGLLDHSDYLGQLGEARERRGRLRRGAHYGELLARVAPAPHVARRLALDGLGEPPTSSRARFSRRRAPRPRLRPLASASSSFASVFGPTPAPQRGAPPQRPRGTRPPSAPRAPAPPPPSASRPARDSAPGRRGPVRCRAPAPRARRSCPSRPAPGAEPRSRGRFRGARVPSRPDQVCHRSRRTADRLGGAAICAHGVGVRVGELQERLRTPQAIGDLRVLHAVTV
jgi:hypothetical protein